MKVRINAVEFVQLLWLHRTGSDKAEIWLTEVHIIKFLLYLFFFYDYYYFIIIIIRDMGVTMRMVFPYYDDSIIL